MYKEFEPLPKVVESRLRERAHLLTHLTESGNACNFVPVYLVFNSFGILNRFKFFLEKEGLSPVLLGSRDIGSVSKPGLYLVTIHPNLQRLRKGLDVTYYFTASDGEFLDYASGKRAMRWLDFSEYRCLREHVKSGCDQVVEAMYTIDGYDDFFRTAKAVEHAVVHNSEIRLSEVPSLWSENGTEGVFQIVDGEMRRVFPHSVISLRSGGSGVIGSSRTCFSEFRLLREFDHDDIGLFIEGLVVKGWDVLGESKRGM